MSLDRKQLTRPAAHARSGSAAFGSVKTAAAVSSPATETGVVQAAELFKALSAPSRVAILRLLDTPHTVTALVEATGISQPLVSQHLRVLREAHLVTVERAGREALYEVADRHISHVVEDAIAHVLEAR